MASPIHQLWSDVVGAWDFDTLTPGGLLRDFGPNGLHLTFPGGAANPTRILSGGFSFDGGDYLEMSDAATRARFYAVAPTGAHCWLVVAGQYTSGGGGQVFSCWNSAGGGVNDGLALTAVAANSFRAYHMQGAAAAPYVVSTTPDPLSIFNIPRRSYGVTVETTPRAIIDGAVVGDMAWGAGAIGTAVYDTAQAPRVGMDPAGTNPYIGNLHYLCLLGRVPTTPELLALNQSMRDGGRPWCNR